MRPLPPRQYLTPDDLDAQADQMEKDAELLPVGSPKDEALKTVAQLRSYADMKRLLGAPGSKAKNGKI